MDAGSSPSMVDEEHPLAVAVQPLLFFTSDNYGDADSCTVDLGVVLLWNSRLRQVPVQVISRQALPVPDHTRCCEIASNLQHWRLWDYHQITCTPDPTHMTTVSATRKQGNSNPTDSCQSDRLKLVKWRCWKEKQKERQIHRVIQCSGRRTCLKSSSQANTLAERLHTFSRTRFWKHCGSCLFLC